MWFCDQCGAKTVGGDPAASDPPVCADHGPRWRLVRNASCAETLVVNAKEQILLGRRARAPMLGQWEIPGGFVERGEHPQEAAVRELREEMGVDVLLTGLLGTFLEAADNGECLAITAYTARLLDPQAVPDPDPAEVSDWGWFELEDVPAAMAGRDRERVEAWAKGMAVGLPPSGCQPRGLGPG